MYERLLLTTRAIENFTKNRLDAYDHYRCSVFDVVAMFIKMLPPNIYMEALQTDY